MAPKKTIDDELEELTTIYRRGGGIGEPGLEQEVERRIDFLKHKQAHELSQKSKSCRDLQCGFDSNKYYDSNLPAFQIANPLPQLWN